MEKTLGNLDQIYDAYKGDLGDGLMLSTKERFAWQASMVEGENILDVGCSQGILDILLAREGKEVLGIDILQDAIDFAEKLKRKESTTTQKNVNFLSGEFTQTQINQTFDTIILGEIIEHQYYPEKIIEKAHKILKDSGVLIITVPFGINDYYDHRKTYYLYDLLKLIRKGFKIEHIYYGQARISADWIGIKVRKNPNFKTDKKTLLLIKDLEKAFYKREREYMKNLSKKKKSISYFSNIVEKLSKAEENYKSTINYKNIQIKNLKDANREYLKEIKEKEKIIKKYNKRKIIRILKLFKKATKIPLKILVEIKRKLSKFYYTIVKILYKPFNKFKKSNLLKLSKSIPDSNGSFYFNKSDAKIGVITDELAYRYYQGAVDIKYINYDNYKEIIDSGIDFLLFITCWYGMKENDWYGLVSNAEIQDKLFKIFDYAKEKDIKIVFQSKEDPSNYQSFLSIAQKADYIFTTDKNKIENYKRDTKNKNVFLLKFGINPLIHNPIGMNDNKRGKFFTRNSVFFAGSWNKRYEERCKDMKLIFNGIRKSGKNLLIADRNYYKKQFNYPSKFLRFLIPNFDYIDLQKIHKLFDWNININSIKSSPTMCAARIYELQALGSLVISNYSLSVYKDFPNIFIINNPSEIKPTLKNYSQKELYKLKIEGIRNVFEKDTVFHRLNFMFEKIGLNKKILYKDNVLVLCEKKTQKVLEMFKKQTYHKKELFLISEVDDIEIQKYDYFTFFSEDNQYGEYYLEDIINCFKFVDVPYVTKKSHFYKNKLKAHSHVYTSSYENKYKTVFNVHEIKITDVLLNKKIKRNGYISDALNLNEQTFPIDNFVNKKKAKLGIVIPVFNNGKFLYGKAFLSLLRNSFFNKIKILLIDDGSNDEKTIVTIKKLAESHKNVMAYFFPKGGSGSPSRARNMGINLLDTEYISFLDPDDEIINQSYEKLLKVLRSYKNLDCIFGFNFMIREGILTKVYSEKKDTIIRNPKEYLIRKRFHLGRIDSAIFRRNFLVNKKLRFLEDSFGEDSLFFIELMLNSPVVYYKHTPVSLYYNDNPESCVNNISHSFFHKYLLKEKILKKKLQKNNLLKKYKEKRFLFYFKDWYCKKLEKVNPKDYKESIYKLKEIASIFSYDIEKKINKKNFDYIQDSNGTSYYKKFEKNIAIITDN